MDTEDIIFVVLLVMVLAIVGMNVRGCVRQLQAEELEQTSCIEAGYADVVHLGEKAFCIGVIDGEWRIKLTDDLNAQR